MLCQMRLVMPFQQKASLIEYRHLACIARINLQIVPEILFEDCSLKLKGQGRSWRKHPVQMKC